MTDAGPAITISRVVKYYGDVLAVNDVSLMVDEGEFVTLLGPSGCGKSTLLRMVAGFIEPNSGDILLHGKSVVGVPPYRRNTSMVFQDYALFPHRTVAQNLAFGLRMRKMPRPDISARVTAMLELLGLPGMGERRITEISGGQQQRVALGRALVVEPAVLLLDEPLGALDFKLRKQMQSELKRIQRQVGITFIYVTHDQEEALTMSDRVAVMNAGQIEQCDTPERVYRYPRSSFVADFVGEANLMTCRVVATQGEIVRVRNQSGEEFLARFNGDRQIAVGEEVRLVVRPENIRIDSQDGLHGTVEDVVFSGAMAKVSIALADGSHLSVAVPAGNALPAKSARVALSWDADNAVIVA
ncbi:MAG TPA: ABC transporter ATP-binding protein [Alphaproteobacteria bacterium]|nr:ABC transporter ATP-binding protein [Alphaproteobacteria bacterium]